MRLGGSTPPGGGSPPVDPAEVDKARRLGRLGIYSGAVAIVFSLVFFPVGLVIDVFAIALGVRARRAAQRARLSEGAGVVSVVLGGIGLSLAIALGSMLAVFWTEIRTYQSCSSGALTHAARADCDTALQNDLRRRVGLG